MERAADYATYGRPSSAAIGIAILVSVSGGGVEIPTLLVEDRSVWIRLFNGEGDAAERTVSLQFAAARVDLVELDGRVVRQLPVRRRATAVMKFRSPFRDLASVPCVASWRNRRAAG